MWSNYIIIDIHYFTLVSIVPVLNLKFLGLISIFNLISIV